MSAGAGILRSDVHPDLVVCAEQLVRWDRVRRARGGDVDDGLEDRLLRWWRRLDTAATGDQSGGTDFAAALRGALPAEHRWSTGWTVLSVSARGRTRVRRSAGPDPVDGADAAHERVLEAGEIAVTGAPGRPPRAGDAVSVTTADTWVDLDTGCWHVRRGAWPPADGAVARLYWAVPASGVVPLVGTLTRLLELTGCGYVATTPVAPRGEVPADALVLDLAARDVAALLPALHALAASPRMRLRALTPRFTQPLARGLGLGYGPDSSTGFGPHRCRLVAGAVRTLPTPARSDPHAVLRVIVGTLRRHGLDPLHPHLPATSARAVGLPAPRQSTDDDEDPPGPGQSKLGPSSRVRLSS